jgi:D-3-phosphoglycerate dehydrogenase
VKELVVCGLFLASRKVAEAIAWGQGLKGEGASVGKLVEKGKGAFGGPEIQGKTLGVVGLGAIGCLVARAAAALGMRVLGVDPYLGEEAAQRLAQSGVTVLDDMAQLFAQSDYITLHIPLTPDTKGFINAQRLAQCKDGVRLLNFSRADLVDSADLIAALESGKALAYVTDFPTDEVLGVSGVTAIPHLGASTPESEDNCAIMAAQQITAYLERGEIKNAVNLPATQLPDDFQIRVCVIHTCPAEEVLAALSAAPVHVVSNTHGGVSYTVADLAEKDDTPTWDGAPGVLRVRIIKA